MLDEIPADIPHNLRALPAGANGWASLDEICAGLEFDLLSLRSAPRPEIEAPPRRIWLDDRATRFALVDADDYEYFSRWRWIALPNSRGRKFYATRTAGKCRTANLPARQFKIFLHVAIMERTGILRPSGHSMCDHDNGDSLDCRKLNMRWATPSMNARNVRRR